MYWFYGVTIDCTKATLLRMLVQLDLSGGLDLASITFEQVLKCHRLKRTYLWVQRLQVCLPIVHIGDINGKWGWNMRFSPRRIHTTHLVMVRILILVVNWMNLDRITFQLESPILQRQPNNVNIQGVDWKMKLLADFLYKGLRWDSTTSWQAVIQRKDI